MAEQSLPIDAGASRAQRTCRTGCGDRQRGHRPAQRHAGRRGRAGLRQHDGADVVQLVGADGHRRDLAPVPHHHRVPRRRGVVQPRPVHRDHACWSSARRRRGATFFAACVEWLVILIAVLIGGYSVPLLIANAEEKTDPARHQLRVDDVADHRSARALFVMHAGLVAARGAASAAAIARVVAVAALRRCCSGSPRARSARSRALLYALLAALFFALVAIGVPVGFVLATVGIACVQAVGSADMMAVVMNAQRGSGGFIFLALPFFILAGFIMDRADVGGAHRRLRRLADRPRARRPAAGDDRRRLHLVVHLGLEGGRHGDHRHPDEPQARRARLRAARARGAAGGLRRDGGIGAAEHRADPARLGDVDLDRRAVHRRRAAGRDARDLPDDPGARARLDLRLDSRRRARRAPRCCAPAGARSCRC